MTDEQMARLRECLLDTARHLSDAAYELSMFARELPTKSEASIPVEIATRRSAAETAQLLATLIDEFELSSRSLNCLHKVGVETIADLVAMPSGRFVRIPHFGFKSRREVNELLVSLGYPQK